MARPTLPWSHALLAFVTVAIWGTNFPLIRVALNEMPPLLFAALRFSFALLPAIFFIRRPAVPHRDLAAYGLLIGVGQFGLMYMAIQSQVTPGLASLLMQMQIFFTIALSMWFYKERVQASQWLALLVGVVGIGIIAAHTDATTTPLGIVMITVAAFSWAAGNMVAKRAASSGISVNMLGFMVWASLYSVPPLLALSFAFEGWPAIRAAVTTASPLAWGAVLWQSYGNTLFGFGVWAWLLARHPAATVTPMALLIPVFGMATSALWLGESLPAWKLVAASFVIGGLALNLVTPRLVAYWRPRLPSN